MVAVNFFSFVVLLIVNAALVSARSLTNAERLARGLSLAPPKRLFEPSRVQHAKRSAAPAPTFTAAVGISRVTIPLPAPTLRKRDVTPAYKLKREAQEQALAARSTSISVPVFDTYIAPESGAVIYVPEVTTVGSQSEAAALQYTVGGATSFGMSSPPNTYYISTCCRETTSCWINPADGSYLPLIWTYAASPAGFYLGSGLPGQSEEYCANLESTFFSVDALTGEVDIQYLNPTVAGAYPPNYQIPPHEPETYIVLINNNLYLTANPTATAELLGSGDLVTLYVTGATS